MKIIITERFEEKYYKKLKKYFDIKNFCKKLKQTRQINLKTPYYKVKFNLWLITFRWVILEIKWWNMIPLLLYLKKDKNYWDNITWISFKKIILEAQSFALKDIENSRFESY